MPDDLSKSTWQDLKQRRSDMWARALKELTEEERHVLDKVLDLESVNRALNVESAVRTPLREFIEREIR